MLRVRNAAERGRGHLEWLQSWFTFSFDQYRDPAHIHWGALRVINEDVIAPGMGFGMHPHHDMEIISFVISGALKHQDNLGNTAILRPGEIQRMTAGTGVLHSEFNPDEKVPTHMLQIWIIPDQKNQSPSWEQIRWSDLPEHIAGVRLIASPDGKDGSARIGQNASVWHIREHEAPIDLPMNHGRKAWLQIATGSASVHTDQGEVALSAGDGLAVSEESKITLKAGSNLSALWFQL